MTSEISSREIHAPTDLTYSKKTYCGCCTAPWLEVVLLTIVAWQLCHVQKINHTHGCDITGSTYELSDSTEVEDREAVCTCLLLISLHRFNNIHTPQTCSETDMSVEKFSIPNLPEEEEAIFQNAFTKDLEDLKTNTAVSSSFCDLFVSVCKMSSTLLFTDKEAFTILQLKDSYSKRLAVLKSVDDKGGEAMLMFYLLLHINNDSAYRGLPSSEDNDEKMTHLANLRDKVSIQNKMADMLLCSTPFHAQGPAKPLPSVATVRPLKKEEMADDDVDVKEKPEKYMIEEKLSARDIGTVEKQSSKPKRGRWGIKKDDEFFHFIIVCFSLGTILIAEFIYSDWTLAAGIGLMSFAILETFGFYFGLVYRIRTVLQDVLPFFQKSPLGLKIQ